MICPTASDDGPSGYEAVCLSSFCVDTVLVGDRPRRPCGDDVARYGEKFKQRAERDSVVNAAMTAENESATAA
jgi:hypothetical protein